MSTCTINKLDSKPTNVLNAFMDGWFDTEDIYWDWPITPKPTIPPKYTREETMIRHLGWFERKLISLTSKLDRRYEERLVRRLEQAGDPTGKEVVELDFDWIDRFLSRWAWRCSAAQAWIGKRAWHKQERNDSYLWGSRG